MRRIANKIRKVLFWKPDMRLVALAAILSLLLLIVPLVRIVLYSVPWYDDYNYGRFVKAFLDEEYSLRSGLQGAVYCVRTQWYAWQGTFSSIFFMCTAPYVWNQDFYFLGPLFLIAILALSVFALVGVLVRDVLEADIASCIILQSITAAAVIVFIYSSQGGFFWYNAGVHYVGMHSFLLLTAAAWIKLLTGKGKASVVFCLIWSLIGAVLGGGANYVTALQGLLLGLTIVALGIFLRRKQTLLLLPSLIVYIVGIYINVTAPGNDKRQAVLSGSQSSMGAVEAVVNSFVEAFRYMWTFTGVRMLAVMLLALPVIWQMLRKTGFRFRLPGLVLLWSFCFYATGYTPSLYALGHAGFGRTLNAVKITWQLLLMLNEVYWLGWLQQKCGEDGRIAKWARQLRSIFGTWQGIPITFYVVMGLTMLGIFAAEPHQAANYSSFCAYWYVHTGEADAFHNEYLARVETIVNGGSVVIVTPYNFRPPICVGDLTDDPENEANRAVADWYGKEAVICRSVDAE